MNPNEDEDVDEDDENDPHLHLHLLTHPNQKAMHIHCTNKVCSSCANNVLNLGSSACADADENLQMKIHSLGELANWSKWESENSIAECRIHGPNAGNSLKYSATRTQSKCYIHGSGVEGK